MITGFNSVDTWKTVKMKNAVIAALLENFLIRKFFLQQLIYFGIRDFSYGEALFFCRNYVNEKMPFRVDIIGALTKNKALGK